MKRLSVKAGKITSDRWTISFQGPRDNFDMRGYRLFDCELIWFWFSIYWREND